jgi:hypothetical protein
VSRLKVIALFSDGLGKSWIQGVFAMQVYLIGPFSLDCHMHGIDALLPINKASRYPEHGPSFAM